MSPRVAGLGVGLIFGIVLSWSGMTSPDVIREALLFQDSYLFLFFGSAVFTGAVGLALLRRANTPRPAHGRPASAGWPSGPLAATSSEASSSASAGGSPTRARDRWPRRSARASRGGCARSPEC